jgi:hypothetical protein
MDKLPGEKPPYQLQVKPTTKGDNAVHSKKSFGFKGLLSGAKSNVASILTPDNLKKARRVMALVGGTILGVALVANPFGAAAAVGIALVGAAVLLAVAGEAKTPGSTPKSMGKEVFKTFGYAVAGVAIGAAAAWSAITLGSLTGNTQGTFALARISIFLLSLSTTLEVFLLAGATGVEFRWPQGT